MSSAAKVRMRCVLPGSGRLHSVPYVYALFDLCAACADETEAERLQKLKGKGKAPEPKDKEEDDDEDEDDEDAVCCIGVLLFLQPRAWRVSL